MLCLGPYHIIMAGGSLWGSYCFIIPRAFSSRLSGSECDDVSSEILCAMSSARFPNNELDNVLSVSR